MHDYICLSLNWCVGYSPFIGISSDRIGSEPEPESTTDPDGERLFERGGGVTPPTKFFPKRPSQAIQMLKMMCTVVCEKMVCVGRKNGTKVAKNVAGQSGYTLEREKKMKISDNFDRKRGD